MNFSSSTSIQSRNWTSPSGGSTGAAGRAAFGGGGRTGGSSGVQPSAAKIRTRLALARSIHRLPHLADGLGHANGQGARDDRIADVELLDFRDRGDRADVGDGETVAGGDDQAVAPGGLRRGDQVAELEVLLLRVGVRARVELDDRRPRAVGGAH